jgi:hypothetical protein
MSSMRWAVLPLLFAGACSGGTSYIRGTKVADSTDNRTILGVVEQYRLAVERRDTAALLALAAKEYWEDGGTPTGADDYGYDGLRDVLTTRFARADGIRYSMRYMGIKRMPGNRAAVDVLIDASYTIQTTEGPVRKDMRDQNELVLRYDGSNWKFLSGM